MEGLTMIAIETAIPMEINPIGAIRAYVASRSDVKPLNGFCEFIDNSLSAEATEITIRLTRKKWQIIDNGRGTSEPEAILSPFVSKAMDSTSRYGVGAACSAIILTRWGLCEVETVTQDGQQFKCVMDWSRYVQERTGRIDLTELSQTEHEGPSGTAITLDVSKAAWKPRINEIVDKLQFLYAAALRKGTRIRIETEKDQHDLAPWNPPKLKHSSKKVLMHPEWGRIEARVGIVASDHANPYAGFNIYWGKRILIDGEAGPCAIRDASSNRIYGEVFLDHDSFGYVNTYKDGFSPQFDQDELWKYLADEFAEVIEKAKTETMTIEHEILSRKAEDTLNRMLGVDVGKEKRERNQDTQKGTVTPANTGTKRKTAEKIHDIGDVVRRDTIKGFPMRSKLVPDTSLEYVITAKYNTRFWEVFYNPDKLPDVAKKNHELLAVLACTIISNAWDKMSERDEAGQKLLPFQGAFEEILTRLLSTTFTTSYSSDK